MEQAKLDAINAKIENARLRMEENKKQKSVNAKAVQGKYENRLEDRDRLPPKPRRGYTMSQNSDLDEFYGNEEQPQQAPPRRNITTKPRVPPANAKKSLPP